MTTRTLLQRTKRSSYALWAFVLIIAVAIPAIKVERAQAYGLLSSRFIKMSNSSSGTLTAGQNVAYELNFTTVTDSASIGSVVIDFCVNNPIIGDTCTAPTGFNTNFGTLSLGTQQGITNFSINTTGGSTANRILLERPAAAVVSAPTTVVVPLGNGTNNGLTNQTPIGTFYARIQTFGTTDGTGANIDAGGVALATTVSLDITSKVQERLKFCVYRDITCLAAGAVPNNAFNLGNNNGVLDSVGPFVDKNTKYDIATNASGGVKVRIKGDTLKTGSFSINAIGATPAASAAGTEQFGFCSYMNAGSAGITIDGKYDGSGGAGAGGSAACTGTSQTSGTASSGGHNSAEFAFDTNATTGTLSTYGEEFATKIAGPEATGTLVFLGNVADTTEAGIYVTTLNLIATGTY